MLTLNCQALWAIFTLTLAVLPEIYNMGMLANHGDTVVVAAAGLGVMFINMFVYGTFEGLNGAVDTFASQYYGAREYESCNLVYNKSRIINTVLFLPIALLLLFSDKVLIWLKQDYDVAIATQQFLAFQIPGLFMVVQYDTLRRYLQAQGNFDVPAKGLILTNIFHLIALPIAMKYFTINPLIVCAMVTNVTMIVDYVLLRYFADHLLTKTNYLGIFDGAFEDWWEYLSIALPSAFIICAEWWMYEVLALFAGLLGVEYLATIVIIFNTHNFVYDISYGLSQAASSLIGRTLAEHGQGAAKKLLYYICLIQLMLCIIMTAIYLTLARSIIAIFTDEPLMVQLYLECNIYIIIMFIIDSTQIVIGGVIRGVGEQGDASVVSFIAYACVTLPFALILSFWFNMELQGIILAYILGIAFCTVFNSYNLYHSEWELAISDLESDSDEETNYHKLDDF